MKHSKIAKIDPYWQITYMPEFNSNNPPASGGIVYLQSSAPEIALEKYLKAKGGNPPLDIKIQKTKKKNIYKIISTYFAEYSSIPGVFTAIDTYVDHYEIIKIRKLPYGLVI